MGTVFLRSGLVSSARPKRSSSQSLTRTNALISRLPFPPHHDFVAAHVHVEQFQRTRRRTRNVAAREIVGAVMAGAPDLLQVAAILHCATEVSAGAGHGAVFAVGTEKQQAGPAAEAKNLGGVGLQFADARRDDGVSTHVSSGGRHKITQDGVDKGRGGGKQSSAEQDLHEMPATGALRAAEVDALGGCTGRLKYLHDGLPNMVP